MEMTQAVNLKWSQILDTILHPMLWPVTKMWRIGGWRREQRWFLDSNLNCSIRQWWTHLLSPLDTQPWSVETPSNISQMLLLLLSVIVQEFHKGSLVVEALLSAWISTLIHSTTWIYACTEMQGAVRISLDQHPLELSRAEMASAMHWRRNQKLRYDMQNSLKNISMDLLSPNLG